MSRRRRPRILFLAGLVLLAAAAAWLVYGWLLGPLYRPGMLRGGDGLREPLAPPPQGGAADRFRVTADIELYHTDVGRGPPVLVVHGGPGIPDARPWPGLETLGDRWRFVFYDQRGCGRSTHPIERLLGTSFWQRARELDRTLGLGAQLADIERIRRILGRDRIVLVGHSFGAFMAALYAAEMPSHVAGLVLVAPASLVVFPNQKHDLFATVGRLLTGESATEYDEFQRELFDFEGNFQKSEGELAALYGRFGAFYGRASGVDPRLVTPEPGVPAGGFMPFAVFLSMGRRHDYSAALRDVGAPVLVVHGERDIEPLAASEEMASWFPSARTVVVPGAGHFVQRDAPAELARRIGEFLAALPPW